MRPRVTEGCHGCRLYGGVGRIGRKFGPTVFFELVGVVGLCSRGRKFAAGFAGGYACTKKSPLGRGESG